MPGYDHVKHNGGIMYMHEIFMSEALELAREAGRLGEVPVGCVIVRDGVAVGRGFNRRESARNALAHAEIIAVDQACRALGGWRLTECDVYVTLEPCAMCAGALINARVKKIYFGAHDPKFGACGSVINLLEQPFNHKPLYTGGILAQDSRELMRGFFARLRENEKQRDSDLIIT